MMNKKQFYELGAKLGRIRTLSVAIHFVVGIATIAFLFLVSFVAIVIVGFVFFIYVLMAGLEFTFEKLWVWLGYE